MSKELKIRFISDIAKAVRDIDRLEKRIDKLNSKAAKGTGTPGAAVKGGGFIRSMMSGGSGTGALTQAVGMFGALTNSTSLLVGAFGGLNPAVIAATTAFYGFIHAMQKTFEFGNLVEGSIIQMEAITGNEKKSRKLIDKAIENSLKTQFTPGQAIGATQMAVQYGIDPYAEGKYGMKGKSTAMDVINAMGSFMDSEGKAMGPQRAVYAITRGDRRLLRPYGRDVQNAYESSKEAGNVGSAAFVDAFMEKLAKIPYLLTLAEKRSNSIEGLWSTISGYAEDFWIYFGGAREEEGVITFWSQIKDILRDIRDYGETFSKYIRTFAREWGTMLGASIKFVWEMLKQIGQLVAPVLIPGFKMLVQTMRIIFEVVKFILNVIIQIGRVLVAVLMIPYRILDALFGVGDKLKNIIDEMSEFVTGLQVTFMLLEIFIKGVVDSIVQGIDNMIAKLKSFAKVFSDFYNNNKRAIDALTTLGASEIVNVLPESKGKQFAKDSLTTFGNVGNDKGVSVSDGIPMYRMFKQLKRQFQGMGNGDTYNFFETKSQDIEFIKNQSGKVVPAK
jgi:phage-related protein